MYDLNCNQDRIEFGKKIRAAREKKGYTQEQLAELLDIAQHQTISSWECGDNTPKLVYAQQPADFSADVFA
jgi:transcriptional regulator with XRE-family HTH domain